MMRMIEGMVMWKWDRERYDRGEKQEREESEGSEGSEVVWRDTGDI